MPKGIYIRTPEMKTGKHMLGRKLSDETRKRLSNSKKGHLTSEETKNKISIANKGKKCPWVKGRPKGYKQSEEHKNKIKLHHLKYPNKGQFKKGQNVGERSWSWKGGRMKNYPEFLQIRMSSEYRLWHKSCFVRDNFTCQKTKISGGRLQVHHINNFADFPELRFALDNGITLSYKTHLEFHNKYGRSNNTREQLNEFLKN